MSEKRRINIEASDTDVVVLKMAADLLRKEGFAGATAPIRDLAGRIEARLPREEEE